VDDPDFPRITYRRGAARRPNPVLSGTGIRVQAIVTAADKWGLSPAEIRRTVQRSPRHRCAKPRLFYTAHRSEIDSDIQSEATPEPKGG